jgi:hypothetical protein
MLDAGLGLETCLNEEIKVPINRSRIDELLIVGGLRWRPRRRGTANGLISISPKKGGLIRSTPPRLKKRGDLSGPDGPVAAKGYLGGNW